MAVFLGDSGRIRFLELAEELLGDGRRVVRASCFMSLTIKSEV